MKKVLHLILLLLCAFTIQAQTNFKLNATSYVGALGADAASDWTTGWTNFDPKNANYAQPTDTTTLNGLVSTLPVPGKKEITTTVTLDATKVYLLKGIIDIKDGGKLIVPAGTVIRALADLSANPRNYGSIFVEVGGKIEISGTATNPVVFTSAKSVGERDRGQWGGIVICGDAPNNQITATTMAQIEAFNTITFIGGGTADASMGKHGGTDAIDNSGFIRYCRIEFAGLALQPDKEINGLTLGSVGSATELRNIQVSFSNDDSFEWFGGTVNSSYLIAFKGTDDDFDTDHGFSGLNQFGIAIRDRAYYDPTWSVSGGSSSEGFESDNDGNGTGLTPYTSAVFSNYTMIGPVPVGSTYASLTNEEKGGFRRGARIRRNSSQRIVNSIFMGYRNFAMIDGDSCIRNTNFAAALATLSAAIGTPVDVKTKQIMFANNLIVNTTAAVVSPTDTAANGLVEVARPGNTPVGLVASKLAAITSWMKQTGALANNIDPVAFTTGTVLVDPMASSTAPNFRPVAGSPALSGANFKDNPILANLFINTPNDEIYEAIKDPVYPNPVTNGTLFLGKQVVSYGIFDISGRLISHGFDTDRANVQNLTKGMYLIKMEGRLQKFIVQ
jgi:hypothetical protein